ncbi:hypothetical protein GW17_00000116, partial [Ensete ventricosum]
CVASTSPNGVMDSNYCNMLQASNWEHCIHRDPSAGPSHTRSTVKREGRRGGRSMATEREKESEAELESAMYTNCLLLGLDPAVLGMGTGSPRDFDKVWPIFDSAQSRDFRKVCFPC